MPKLELNKSETEHLQNDLIAYIWSIKEHVFGKHDLGVNITEVEELSELQAKKLTMYGYFERLELLNKIDAFLDDNFELPTGC